MNSKVKAKKFFKKDKQSLLKTVQIRNHQNVFKERTVQQIMNKTIDMDQYIHSTCQKSDDTFVKTWLFKKENAVHALSYNYGWQFRQGHGYANGYYRKDEWHIMDISEKLATKINNINDWIKDYQCYLEDFKEKYTLLQSLLESVMEILGETTFSTRYETGWYINGGYKMSIQKFEFPEGIEVCFYDTKIKSPKPKKITNVEFLAFVKKNKKRILKIKEEVEINHQHKLNVAKLERMKLPKMEEEHPDQRCINMMRARPGIDNEALYKKKMARPSELFIYKPLKERYEIQACKPFPEDSEMIQELSNWSGTNLSLNET